MRSFKRSFVVALIFVLALFSFIDNANAQQDLFPWVRFIGGFQTTAGIGTGSFILNGSITEMDYENGDVWTANVAGIETIKGSRVAFNGATRTGDYSFNGNNDVTLTITTFDGAHTYFEATMTDVSFECDTALPVTCWLNEGLDANALETLNLTSIRLSTTNGLGGLPASALYPSRYIEELSAYLAASNASGMKMSLLIPPAPGFDFTANSSGPITFGLIDGLQSVNPLTAEAGTTDPLASCTAIACPVTLNGAGSSPAASIIDYSWYFDAGVLGVYEPGVDTSIISSTSEVVNDVFLPYGTNNILLVVSDGTSTSADSIEIVVAAELAFEAIDKVYVKRDGKVKISGRVAAPAGLTHFDIGSVGRAIIDIPSLGSVPEIDESVDFVENSNGNKWKYSASTVDGLTKFSIDWDGAKFHYPDGPVISTDHIGETETELSIISCSPVTVDINGTIITVDANDNVSCSNAGAKIDGDDDGDSDDSDSDGGNSTDDDDDCTIGVRLPFALTAGMIISIDDGVTVKQVSVGQYLTVAVGKFKIHGRFIIPAGTDFSTLDPSLDVTMALGVEEFAARLVFDNQTWTKIKPKYWKYKSN